MGQTARRLLRGLRHDAGRWIFLAVLLLPAYDFFKVSLGRISYPYEVEWVEGEIALHALRFRDTPSLAHMYPDYENGTYVPWLYGPFYQMLLAGLFGLFDSVHPGLGRLLSLLATLGILAGIAAIVRAHTRSLYLAAASGLSYLWFFKASGYWYDLARVDSLALCLAVWSAYFIVAKPGRWYKLSFGLALGLLAHFTKQTSMFIPAAVLGFSVSIAAAGFLARRLSGRVAWLRRCARFIPRHDLSPGVLIAFLLLLAGTALLLRGDAYAPLVLYLYKGPGQHAFIWERILERSVPELWQFYAFAAWVVPAGLWAALLSRRWKGRRLPWALSLAGILAAGGLCLWVLPYRRLGGAILSRFGAGEPGFLSVPAMRLVASAWSLPVLLAAALTLGGCVVWAARWALYRTPLPGLFWLPVLFAAQHVGVMTRVKIGAYVNSFMGLFVVQSIVLGLALSWLLRATRRTRWRPVLWAVLSASAILTWVGTREPFVTAPRAALARGEKREAQSSRYADPMLVARQADLADWSPFVTDGLRYDLRKTWYRPWSTPYGSQIPKPEALEAGRKLLALIGDLDRQGGVYLPHQNYLGMLAGVAPGPSIDAIRDVTMVGFATPQRLLQRVLAREDRYIVLMFPLAEEWFPGDFRAAVEQGYRQAGRIDLEGADLRLLAPKTGALVYPRFIYERQ